MKKLKKPCMLFVSLSLMLVLAGGLSMFTRLPGTEAAAPAQTMSIQETAYHVPGGTDIWGTTMDSQGNVWVALPGCDPDPTCSGGTPPGKIATFDPSTSKWVEKHALPSGYAQALFLKFDQQGRLWFPLPMSNSIGMFDPATKKFQKWTVPTADAGPWDLTIDAQGNIWFTEHFGAQIGRFDPSNDTFQEYATPSASSQPYGITIDASGNIWYTENNSAVASIGKYTTQGQMLEYKIRNNQDPNLTPHLITVDGNGNIWWTEGFDGMLGELNVSKAQPGTNNGVTEYPYTQLCQSCGMHTSGIGVDSNGQLWFDDSLQGLYGSFPDSGTGNFKLWKAPGFNNNPHPHDGLMVDSQNRIWFDEEFANKLVKVIYIKKMMSTPSPSPTLSLTPTQ